MIANTPKPPYYAVIFTSSRTPGDNGCYADTSNKMVELASKQHGFLGIESAREDVGITVSYWKDLDAIKNWKNDTDHAVAREKGKQDWYSHFKVRIAKVERDYGFDKL